MGSRQSVAKDTSVSIIAKLSMNVLNAKLIIRICQGPARKFIRVHGRRCKSKLVKISLLKVPKCEIFHLFDFNDFYVIKSL
jgi:hypothetical protein